MSSNKQIFLVLKLALVLSSYMSITNVEGLKQLEGRITLSQGTVIGLKVFPESSKTAVYTFLGIPYAQPPVGDLRFAPPQKSQGWNKTLLARDFRPLCPQLDNSIFDESHSGIPYKNRNDEDCLYLNIWMPEEALASDSLAAVVVILTGEHQAFDWTRNRPTGLDLSAEGIVVVSVQSRTNIFGWLSLRSSDAPGNLGLLDQQLALQWVRENIQKFGGDSKQVTLLGHGTSGATNALLHLTSPKGSALFSKLIAMSGTVFSKYSFQMSIQNEQEQDIDETSGNEPSQSIVRKLACESSNTRFVLDCLRQKSVADLLKAFENVYQHGNYTQLLGPQIDTYLPPSARYIPDNPLEVLQNRNYPDIPIVIGICSNEGAFMQELWMDMAKESYKTLKAHIDNSILPNILMNYGAGTKAMDQIEEAINWRFFDQIPHTPLHLLNAMQRLISETYFEAPFLETLEALVRQPNKLNGIELAKTNRTSDRTGHSNDISLRPSVMRQTSNVYVYTFHISNSMDLRGIINYFGGASHSSELPFLMGPSLFQQISRRKFTANELKLCKKVREKFGNFIKKGNPTPDRLYDAWQPYTDRQKFIQILGEQSPDAEMFGSTTFTPSFEMNRAILEKILLSAPGDTETRIISNAGNPYQIGASENAIGTRTSKNYLGDYETNGYYNALTKVYSFWNKLLPGFYRHHRLDDLKNNKARDASGDDGTGRGPLTAGVVNGSKYKHAFFSMLILVCLLLAVLCVCVYILKKNHQNIDTSFL